MIPPARNSPRALVPFDWGVYACWADLYGSQSTVDDIRKSFSRVPKGLATAQITSLCAQLQPTPESTFAIDAQARALLLSADLEKRFGAWTTKTLRLAFHRTQLLLGLQLAQTLCNTENPLSLSQAERTSAREALGESLLRVTDFLNRSLAASDWRTLLPVLLPLYESSNSPALLTSLRRMHTMLLDSEWNIDGRLRSASDRFHRAMGLSPLDYMYVVLGLATKVHQRGHRTDPSLRFGDVFARARDAAAIRAVLDGLSTPIDDLPREVSAADTVLAELPEEPFRSRPLIKLPGDRFWPIDYHFLIQGALSGVFWKLMDLSSSTGREDLLSVWGQLFERCMNDRLSAMVKAYRRNPEDSLGQELTDGLIVEKPDIVFFEFKASLLSAKAKAARSSDVLQGEIERKFLKRNQAGRALARLIGDPVLSKTLLCRAPARVYPLLVALDYSMAAPFVSRLADEGAKALGQAANESGARLEPLTIITADDVEALAVLKASGKKVRNVIRECLLADPERASTFHNHLVGHARRMGVPSLLGEKEDFRDVFSAAASYWTAQSSMDLFATI